MRDKRFLKTLIYITSLILLPLMFKENAYAKVSSPEGMKRVCENDSLALYINEEKTDIAVVDKETGKTWYSNPQNADDDPFASAYYKRFLHSQLQVTYFNENVQASTMDNYNDSILNGQFETEYFEDGVKINYFIGKAASMLTLPEVISQERLDSFKEKMSKAQLKKINRNYTLIDPNKELNDDAKANVDKYKGYEGKAFYVLRSGVKDYLKEELATYFEEAGYTSEDLEADLLEAGGEEEESDDPWFKISLQYKLYKDRLVASIDPKEIEYNDNGYYLVDIDVLPYFGAAGTDESGYIFVPDGSGSLINLNNQKTNVTGYTANVYGDDLTKNFMNAKASEADPALSIKLPVFGLKTTDKAFLAVITNGEGYANISADISGKTTSYNNVFAGFSYLQYGPMSLGSMVGSNSYQLYSKADFSSNYEVSYFFLNEDDADYCDMADCYREYLINEKGLEKKDLSDDVLLLSEFIGAIDKYKTILGVRYSGLVKLTDYNEALDITNDLYDNGVKNQAVVYAGWQKGGLKSEAETSIKSLSKLNKNGVNIEKFDDELSAKGINSYFTVDLQHVYEDKAFDGFNKLSDAPQYFDHTAVYESYTTVFDLSKVGVKGYLVSPLSLSKASKKVDKYFNKKDLSGIAFTSISNNLFSDYPDSRYTDRQASKLKNEESIALLSKDRNVLSDNANEYAATKSDVIMNAPLYSNDFKILDKDIPFYELVFHGYKDYTGEPLNLADSYEISLLKCVETGAGLHFKWISEDNSVLKETDYEDFYAINYDSLKERALGDYLKVNEAMKGLKNEKIVKHEEVKDGVIKVTYEDGTKVYVNYTDEAFSEGSVNVKPMNFYVGKENR